MVVILVMDDLWSAARCLASVGDASNGLRRDLTLVRKGRTRDRGTREIIDQVAGGPVVLLDFAQGRFVLRALREHAEPFLRRRHFHRVLRRRGGGGLARAR